MFGDNSALKSHRHILSPFHERLLCNTNICAQLAGSEEGLDGGAKTHNVELGARRETL